MDNLKTRFKERREKLKNVKLRFEGMTFSRLLPNIVTLGALCAGLSSVRWGLEGRYEGAVFFILIAAFLDGMDGRLARMFGGASRFGAELDSLADFINFGVAPAVLLYLFNLKLIPTLGWGVVLLYVICSALRLARFNVMSIEEEKNPETSAVPEGFFLGVPIPMGAFLVLLPLFLSFDQHIKVYIPSWVICIWVVVVSLLLVSRIFTFSLKKIYIPRKYVLSVLLSIGGGIIFFLEAPWITLFAAGVIYVFSIPFIHKKGVKKQKKETEV